MEASGTTNTFGAGVRQAAVILMAVLYEISRWLTTLFSDEGNNAPLDIVVDTESSQFDQGAICVRKQYASRKQAAMS